MISFSQGNEAGIDSGWAAVDRIGEGCRAVVSRRVGSAVHQVEVQLSAFRCIVYSNREVCIFALGDRTAGGVNRRVNLLWWLIVINNGGYPRCTGLSAVGIGNSGIKEEIFIGFIDGVINSISFYKDSAAAGRQGNGTIEIIPG